jgi:hypothetical protein
MGSNTNGRQEETGGRVYHSKVDRWLAAILWVTAGILVFSPGSLFFISMGWAWRLAGLIVYGAALALVLTTLMQTRYTLMKDRLIVRCGVFRWIVPLRAITDVSPTRSPLSSPALSLDRLRIRYAHEGTKKEIMISPAEKAAFLRDLAAAAPHSAPPVEGRTSSQ